MIETTAHKNDRAQKLIDNRLSDYFNADQLAPLTSDEIEILSEYFSNQQYKELKLAPATVLKSLVARHTKTVERQRLINVPVDEVSEMLEYYKEIADEVEVVNCTKCGNDIAIEIKHPEYKSDQYFHNPNQHWQGRFVIGIGNRLLGYRKRHDDVMGYRCGCGIPNPEYKAAVEQYEKDLKAYQVAKTDWDIAVEEHREKHKAWKKIYQKEVKSKKRDHGDITGAPDYPVEPVKPVMPNIPEFTPCANETTMSKAELEAIPDDHLEQSVISQADILKVKQYINETGYKKPVKKVKSGYLLDDKFLLRKVK
jgi:hypothetical protein